MLVPRSIIQGTGIESTRLGIGTAGWPGRHGTKEVAAVLRSAFDIGIRHLDTAPKYNTESRVAAALEYLGAPHDLVVATKVCVYHDPELRITYGSLSPDGIRRSIERSLKMLRRDTLDIVYVHDLRQANLELCLSQGGPFEVLQELKSAGVIRAVGTATRDPAVLAACIRAGVVDVVQGFHANTLLNRSAHDQMYPLAGECGVGVLDSGPYAGYILATGSCEGAQYNYQPASPEVMAATRRLESECARIGISLSDAAVAFSLRHPAVSVLTIGSGNPDHVRRWGDLTDSPLDDRDFEALLGAAGPSIPFKAFKFERFVLSSGRT